LFEVVGDGRSLIDVCYFRQLQKLVQWELRQSVWSHEIGTAVGLRRLPPECTCRIRVGNRSIDCRLSSRPRAKEPKPPDDQLSDVHVRIRERTQ
jgi:hypothetical protein